MGVLLRGGWARCLSAGVLMALGTMQAQAADPIRIGFTGPLSGSLFLLGNGVRDGLQTAVEAANAQGGIHGRKIELIAEDDAYDPTRTLAAARKLAEQNKVLALVEPTGTPNVAALVPYATERKLPILAPYAFSNTLTTPTKRYVFTTLPEVRVQANVLGDYLVSKLQQKKIAAIYQNDDFGQDAVSGLEARMKKDGIPLTKLPFDRGSTNFSGVGNPHVGNPHVGNPWPGEAGSSHATKFHGAGQGPESWNLAGSFHMKQIVVSELCVMDSGDDGRLGVVSLHAGVTRERVDAATGFELVWPRQNPITEPPADEERTLLESRIDPTGLRFLEALTSRARRARLRELLNAEEAR